jgi:hypothetical protein
LWLRVGGGTGICETLRTAGMVTSSPTAPRSVAPSEAKASSMLRPSQRQKSAGPAL